MALLNEINEAITDAFDTDLSDAVTSFTAKKYSDSQSIFDPSTGNVTRTATSFSVRGVLVSDKELEKSNIGGEPNLLKFLCLVSELDYELTIGDTLENSSEKFTIYGIEQDPVKATCTYTLKGET